MKVLGIDFTSAPRRAKPITCLHCTLEAGCLRAVEMEALGSFAAFEALLQRQGPWIAGLDFPFGQSRTFIENIGWPKSWQGYVGHVGSLERESFRRALEDYKAPRRAGDKEHRRAFDVAASSISPQKLYGVPVGLMFFEGAPRLLASGVSIPHLREGDPSRIAVEAYPGVLARRLIGRRSYKNDEKKKQSEALRQARLALLDKLVLQAPEIYGFRVEAEPALCEDPSGDHLDALLCAVQAAWAWSNRDAGWGAVLPVDPLEGWIADPSIGETPPPKARPRSRSKAEAGSRGEPLLARIAAWGSTPDLPLSSDVDKEVRLAIIDTLAAILAGRSDPTVAKLVKALRRDCAAGPAALLTSGGATDGPRAALLHGFAAHVLDFDDYEGLASTHPSAVLVPVLLALSDLRPVTLGAIVSAYVVGYETIVRLGLAMGGYRHYARGWHTSATLGPFGAAAAAARLLGLSAPAFASALAMASSASAGLKAQFGSDAKPLHAGLAARNGLEAALLAGAGLSGRSDVMEGPYGFLALYGDPRFGRSLDGAQLAIEEAPILRKPWPSCAYTHRSIEAALTLAAQPGFACESVVSGVIEVPEPYYRAARFGVPQNAAEARFSLPYCVAVALLERSVLPEHFGEAALRRPEVMDLAGRLAVSAYETGPNLQDMSPDAPDRVVLRMAEGSSRAHSVGHVRGGPKNPMSPAEVIAKLQQCGGSEGFAVRLLESPAEAPWRFADEISGLEAQP